jgi:DNA-binding beta-propeller fold protein YncE
MLSFRHFAMTAAAVALVAPTTSLAQTRASFERTLARAPVVESPRDVAFSAGGAAYIADDRRNELIRLAPDGTATVLAGPSDTFSQPHGVTLDGSGQVVVAERDRAISRFGGDGQRKDRFDGAVGGETIRPIDVALLPDGLVVVEQRRILRFRGTGDDALTDSGRWAVLAGGFQSLTAVIAVDAERVAVTDAGDRRLKLVALADGAVVDSVGGDGTALEEFRQPDGLALRENGDLLVADTFNDRIKVFPGQAGQDRLVAPHVLEAQGMERPGCVAVIPGGDSERIATCTGVIDYPSHQGERRVDLFSFGRRPAPPASPSPPVGSGPGGSPQSPAEKAPAAGSLRSRAVAGLERRGFRCVRRARVTVCRRKPNASLRVVARPGAVVGVRERGVLRRAQAGAGGVAVIRSPRRFAAARVRTVTVRVDRRTVRARLR